MALISLNKNSPPYTKAGPIVQPESLKIFNTEKFVGDDALVQVYPDGIRHIRADKRVNEWKAPGKKTVIRCAVNRRQVVIALSGGELVYFEMDPVIFLTY